MLFLNKVINRWIAVMGIFMLIFGGFTYYFRDSRGNASFHEGDNTVETVENIQLDLLKTNVYVLPTTEDKIRIRYKSIVPISVMLGDNRLVIEESDEFVLSFLTGDDIGLGLWLYLPKGIYEDITLHTASGNAEVGRIDSHEINVITKSGNIKSTDTRSLVNLITGTGDILLDCEYPIAGSTLESRSGNAEIVFPKGSSVALAYETENGRFESDLIRGSIEGSYMYGFNGGENLISADIVNGTLTVSEK